VINKGDVCVRAGACVRAQTASFSERVASEHILPREHNLSIDFKKPTK
jgi:hypothetical protein